MTEPYCSFTVGDKIVCVDASPRCYPGTRLKIGNLYTVSEVVCITSGSDKGKITVRLQGVPHKGRWGFYADRFRPIQSVSTSTSMDILRKIVAKQFNKVPA